MLGNELLSSPLWGDNISIPARWLFICLLLKTDDKGEIVVDEDFRVCAESSGLGIQSSQKALVELEKAKIIIDLKSLERKITVNIIDKVRDSNILKEVAINEAAVSDLQAQKLEAEQKRFSQGRSDTDTIVRFQNDVSLARISAAEAKYAYYVAVIDLRKEEGSLLNKYWNEEL